MSSFSPSPCFLFSHPIIWSKLILVSSVCFDGKSNIDIPLLRVTRSLHVASSRAFFDLVFLKQRKIFTISNLKYLPGLCGRGDPCIPPFYNIPGRSFGHPLGFCLFFIVLAVLGFFLFFKVNNGLPHFHQHLLGLQTQLECLI